MNYVPRGPNASKPYIVCYNGVCDKLPISTTTSRALEIRISLFLYDTFHLLYISQVLFTAASIRPQNESTYWPIVHTKGELVDFPNLQVY